MAKIARFRGSWHEDSEATRTEYRGCGFDWAAEAPTLGEKRHCRLTSIASIPRSLGRSAACLAHNITGKAENVAGGARLVAEITLASGTHIRTRKARRWSSNWWVLGTGSTKRSWAPSTHSNSPTGELSTSFGSIGRLRPGCFIRCDTSSPIDGTGAMTALTARGPHTLRAANHVRTTPVQRRACKLRIPRAGQSQRRSLSLQGKGDS